MKTIIKPNSNPDIIYSPEDVLISDLKLNHPIFEKWEFLAEKFYADEAKYFNYYDIPVVTEDLVLLSNIHAYKAALDNGLKKMEVVVAVGLHIDDTPRFINFGMYVKKMTETEKGELVSFLRDYMENNPRGRDWAASLEGDINHKIGTVTGYSFESVKGWARAAKRSLEVHQDGSFSEVIPANECQYNDDEVTEAEYNSDNFSEIKNETTECTIPIWADTENEEAADEESIATSEENLTAKSIRINDFKFELDGDIPHLLFKGVEQAADFEESTTENTICFTFKFQGDKGSVKVIVTGPGGLQI